jgi:glycosyltransferase involved in cell wall biosynthesis/GT2 family glycosyltransferase
MKMQSNQPLISVSLISHSEKKHLEVLLPSLIQSLEGLRYELLLVDNCSRDETLEFLRKKYPQIIISVNRKQRGYGANHNLNIRRALGKYILVLNADLRFEKDTVRDMLDFMERNPDCGVSTCRLMDWDDRKIQHNCRTFPTLVDIWARRFPFKNKQLHIIADRHEMLHRDYVLSFETDWFQGSFMLFRQEALNQINGFDERFLLYFEDVDACRRMRMAGWKVLYNGGTFVHHRFHRQSANPLNRMFWVHLSSMARYFNKYGWKILSQTAGEPQMEISKAPRVAIVHDYLTQYGGAERVLEMLLEIYPGADLYTLVRQRGDDLLENHLNMATVKTSLLQNLPGSTWGQFREYLGFMPLAVEDFDLSGYDIVISSSSAWVKGVITDPRTMHVCYLHSPMRFVWDWYHQTLKEYCWPVRSVLKLMLSNIRRWDVISAQRPDVIIANSREVQKRIRKYYRRDSKVLYPAVDTEAFVPQNEGGHSAYYLVVSRLKPYKMIDIAIRAFNAIGQPLVVVGDGSEMRRLKKMAQDNIIFAGKVSDSELIEYYQNCRALIFPTLEDFGLTPVEAQCCGKPVIAFGKGGAVETVVEGKTGVFFYDQTVEALVDAISRFEKMKFNRHEIRKHAVCFGKKRFANDFRKLMEQEYANFKKVVE